MRVQHGFEDLAVAGAAAEHPGQRVLDLRCRRAGIAGEEFRRNARAGPLFVRCAYEDGPELGLERELRSYQASAGSDTRLADAGL